MKMFEPTLAPTPEVIKAAQTIREFAAKHSPGDSWQVGGLMPIESSIGYYKAKWEAAERQLDQVTRERDHYKAACALADALRNKERGYENK